MTEACKHICILFFFGLTFYLPCAGLAAFIDWVSGTGAYGIWNERMASGSALAWLIMFFVLGEL